MYKRYLLSAGLVCIMLIALLIWHLAPTFREKSELKILRVPAAILETKPVTQNETVSMQNHDLFHIFTPVTHSKIEVDAKYRYQVALKNTWNFVFIPKHVAAFIIMPDLKPVVPVEYEIIRDKTVIGGVEVDSKWFWKPNCIGPDWERMELFNKLHEHLVTKATSVSILALRKEDARQLVEAHIRNWLIMEGYCKAADAPIVKVFTKDEADQFPFPMGVERVLFKP